jgi:ubiquinone/menaquinone biosynthesis C-methylase UbiE
MNTESEMPWWHCLYDDNLATMLLENTDSAEVESTVDFLKKHLSLTPGQRVFDQCCGTGRLALALAKHHDVVGVDLISSYIDYAKEKAKRLGKNTEFITGDAFQYKLTEPADIAINWSTSFGYSEDDEQNISMMQRAFDSIKSNGFYALDFMNVPGIYRNFLKDVVTSVNQNGTELILVRKSTIDFSKDRLLKEWRYFTKNGEKARYHSDVSLYTPAQLINMFEKVGFGDIQLFGDLEGESLSLDSPRCIVVGRKP